MGWTIANACGFIRMNASSIISHITASVTDDFLFFPFEKSSVRIDLSKLNVKMFIRKSPEVNRMNEIEREMGYKSVNDILGGENCIDRLAFVSAAKAYPYDVMFPAKKATKKSKQ